MRYYKDKIAVVTGGGAGIGKGLAEELASAGARVIVADIDMEKAGKTAEAINNAGGKAEPFKADVTIMEDIQKLADHAVSAFGRIDLMINNAGVALMGEVCEMGLEQFRRLVDVNIMGIIHGCRAAYPQMIKQGYGHIVNVGSVTGLFTFPMQTHYSATKHFVQAFTMGLRAEAAGLGVKISVICPMNIKSEMVEGSITIVGDRDNEWFRNLPVKWMDVNTAAKKMLKGIARNKGIIVVPGKAKIFWRLYRLSPAMFNRAGVFMVKAFRDNKI